MEVKPGGICVTSMTNPHQTVNHGWIKRHQKGSDINTFICQTIQNNMPNVGKYTLHWWYGIGGGFLKSSSILSICIIKVLHMKLIETLMTYIWDLLHTLSTAAFLLLQKIRQIMNDVGWSFDLELAEDLGLRELWLFNFLVILLQISNHQENYRKIPAPGDSKWPCDSLVGGHQQPFQMVTFSPSPKGHVRRIARQGILLLVSIGGTGIPRQINSLPNVQEKSN